MHATLDRLGIMRSDYTPSERDVGEVLAIGIEVRIGRIRGTA